ncbi:cation efflux family-domain-containing protein [Suillus paluster]|uniref:cation efflux family-domain-containing protein n=1 Tax=Suillus paluster TaxID=48578 RepID=UPI001B883BA7|nr:cation efflux family-domain-containing protein [Suillus paluster]KAG1755206.1 cation efflux family-domain-containing protein [Suillus paluster]
MSAFGMSRSGRITLLLIIDVVFFFIELIAGYSVGSLALVADSFHMLNDVISLVVALYAIKLSQNSAIDSRYSYGWHRAEILAALINGVFLLALCFSITMEALERFFSTPDISNPRLIVIVGSFGLASNIVGLFLFHEGSHAHGHDHKTSPSPTRPPSITQSDRVDDDVTPPRRIPGWRSSRERSSSYSSMYGHPIATRASVVQAAQDIASPPPHARRLTNASSSSHVFDESAPLLGAETTEASSRTGNISHHGHAHGSMNMRALVLHVLGDALGNVGVIATGLVIWLTNWKYKFYFDPVISLVITAIIFSSALPLVRSASFILLQGVPPTISLDEVRESILNVDGVLSVHELHVWQLSESKIVASVHVMASRNHDFMPVAADIRKTLHHHGIHSSTIQPEYHPRSPTEDHLKTSTDSSCLILCPADQNCDPVQNACCRESSIYPAYYCFHLRVASTTPTRCLTNVYPCVLHYYLCVSNPHVHALITRHWSTRNLILARDTWQ